MNDQSSLLMASYIGLVRALAWKIHQQLPPSVELDDLVGYGCVGLAEAAQGFDASRGLKFSTYAYWRIRGAIFDGLSQMAWFRPEEFAARAYRRGSEGTLQGPDEGQTADVPDDPLAGSTVNDWQRKKGESLLRGRSAQGPTAAADVPDRSPSGETAAAQKELEARLRQLIQALPKAAAELLIATYYEGLSLKAAGERMGRNKSWASRLHARALQTLASALRAEGLGS